MTIKELRIQQGLSQRDFAQKAGIARSALQKYENGQAVPTPLVLQRIWEAFGQTVSAEEATVRKPEIIIQSPYGGEISAEEVAQRVGYSSLSRFSIVYKGYWGHSPRRNAGNTTGMKSAEQGT